MLSIDLRHDLEEMPRSRFAKAIVILFAKSDFTQCVLDDGRGTAGSILSFRIFYEG